MTSEVCVMNRQAVVLAADSASTVSGWVNGRQETRYFKGANKIFQLSDHHPVGLMIYDGADILRVPWEVVVKEFRRHLGNRSFVDIAGYAAEFFNFLETDARLFPTDVQRAAVVEVAKGVAFGFAFDAEREAEDGPGRAQALRAGMAAANDMIEAAPYGCGLPAADAEAFINASIDEVAGYIEEILPFGDTPAPDDPKALARCALTLVLKRPQDHLGTTGLVFAGFGDHDIFPSYVQYTSAGVVAGHHLSDETSRASVSHDLPAAMAAFAQTGMSDTFQLGFTQDVFTAVLRTVSEAFRDFAAAIAGDCGGDAANMPNLEELTEAARQKVSDAWLNQAREQHVYPLRRVLGVLPIDEMAELAETLINLQSLKEKVTKDTATVGGPIDVAVITKAEGLVWIKRKHFFEPKLNSRFGIRQANLLK